MPDISEKLERRLDIFEVVRFNGLGVWFMYMLVKSCLYGNSYDIFFGVFFFALFLRFELPLYKARKVRARKRKERQREKT